MIEKRGLGRFGLFLEKPKVTHAFGLSFTKNRVKRRAVWSSEIFGHPILSTESK
jgi:hypothetical protein